MKRLAIDIETSPNLAHVWGLWNNNVSLSQLQESTRVLCFAAQWEGSDACAFYSEWDHGPEMIDAAWDLLNAADEVIHYNGKRFDVPHLNREFIEREFLPPAPYKQIDLLKQIQKAFRFPSFKLEYVAPALGVGEKVKHAGHDLWVRVMAGEPSARAEMRTYNIQDTRLMFPLYHKVLPWITTPNAGLYGGEGDLDVCPGCGSENLMPQGFANLVSGRYQRYVCADCGKWSRGSKRVGSTEIVPVAT